MTLLWIYSTMAVAMLTFVSSSLSAKPLKKNNLFSPLGSYASCLICLPSVYEAARNFCWFFYQSAAHLDKKMSAQRFWDSTCGYSSWLLLTIKICIKSFFRRCLFSLHINIFTCTVRELLRRCFDRIFLSIKDRRIWSTNVIVHNHLSAIGADQQCSFVIVQNTSPQFVQFVKDDFMFGYSFIIVILQSTSTSQLVLGVEGGKECVETLLKNVQLAKFWAGMHPLCLEMAKEMEALPHVILRIFEILDLEGQISVVKGVLA